MAEIFSSLLDLDVGCHSSSLNPKKSDYSGLLQHAAELHSWNSDGTESVGSDSLACVMMQLMMYDRRSDSHQDNHPCFSDGNGFIHRPIIFFKICLFINFTGAIRC